MALGPDHVRATHRSAEGTSATFGAVGAAASLARLDEQGMRYALSYAAQQVSGLWSWVRDEEHVEKAFDFAGMGARNGVTAAPWCRPASPAWRTCSTASTTCSSRSPPKPKPEEMVAGLGTPLLRHRNRDQDVLGRLSDPGAARRAAHAAPGARAHRRTTSTRIVVRLPEDGARIVDNSAMPDVNCQHLIAVALIDGTRLVRDEPLARAHAGPAGAGREGARAARRRPRADGSRTAPRSGLVEVTLQRRPHGQPLHAPSRRARRRTRSTRRVADKVRDLMAPVLAPVQAIYRSRERARHAAMFASSLH